MDEKEKQSTGGEQFWIAFSFFDGAFSLTRFKSSTMIPIAHFQQVIFLCFDGFTLTVWVHACVKCRFAGLCYIEALA